MGWLPLENKKIQGEGIKSTPSDQKSRVFPGISWKIMKLRWPWKKKVFFWKNKNREKRTTSLASLHLWLATLNPE